MRNRELFLGLARDLLIMAGGSLVVFGVWGIYPPAGIIAAGLALAGIGIVGALRGRSKRGADE